MALAGAVDRVAARERLHGSAFVKSSHVPIPRAWMPYLGSLEVQTQDRETVLRFIREHRPHRLIVAARWSCYLEGPSRLELTDQPEDANWYAFTDSNSASRESSHEVIAEGLQALVSLCEEIDTTLVVVRQVPECGLEAPSRSAVNFAMQRIPNLPSVPQTYQDFATRRSSFDRILDEIRGPQVLIVDPAPRFRSGDGGVIVFSDGVSNYRDADHLSWSGLGRLDAEIVEALGCTEIPR